MGPASSPAVTTSVPVKRRVMTSQRSWTTGVRRSSPDSSGVLGSLTAREYSASGAAPVDPPRAANSAEPSERERHLRGGLDAVREGRLVRAAACVAAICWIAMHGPILASFTLLLPPSVYLPLASGLGIALPVAMCVLACACARRVENLADRLENTAAGLNTRLHDGLTMSVGALAVAFVFGVNTTSACLIVFGGVGMLIGGTLLLLVHLGMVRSLRSSLADAREGRTSSRRQSWLERPFEP